MLDKLASIEARYEQLLARIADPAVQADPAEYRANSKALAEIEDLVARGRELRTVLDEIAQARELADGTDTDLRELARDELARLELRQQALVQDIRRLLVPKDPNDEKNVVLEIRAGTGGDEAGLFASDLLRMYARYAERKGWRLEILSQSEGSVGGVKEVIASIEGKNVYSRLKYESGVHRVQRVPDTEASGRIHTSTSTVAVLPEAEDVDVQIDDFGTGYASLTMLKRIEIDRLKIDRSFVRHVDTDARDQAIVDAITRMARACKLEVIAEGIETEVQASFMKDYATEAQGYLFGKPMRAAEFQARFLSAFSADCSAA